MKNIKYKVKKYFNKFVGWLLVAVAITFVVSFVVGIVKIAWYGIN